MKTFLYFVLALFFFSFLASKCGNDNDSSSYKPEPEKVLTPAEKKEADRRSAEELRDRLIVEEAAKKEEALEEKRFLKSKAGKIYKKHPEWSKEDCQMLADRQIWIGMSISMLKYNRGLPDHANPSNYGKGTSWQWCWNDYTPSCFYDKDDDGLIDSYN